MRSIAIVLLFPSLALAEPKLVLQQGHSSAIQGAAFSPDGALVATASNDHSVIVWDAAAGLQLRSLLHPATVASVAFAGKELVTGCIDGKVRFWDALTGRQTRVLEGVANLRSMALSGDGSLIALGGLGIARVLRAADGSEVRAFTLPPGWNVEVALSADGKRLAAGGAASRPEAGAALHVWSVQSGKEVAGWQTAERVDLALAFSADGASVSFTTGDYFNDVKVALLKVALGKVVAQRSLPAGGRPAFAAGSPGVLVAGGLHTGLRSVSLPDAGPIEDLVADAGLRFGGSGHVEGFSVRRDGKVALLWRGTSAAIFSLPDGQKRATLAGISRSVLSLSFDRSGRRLYLGQWGEGLVLALSGGESTVLKGSAPTFNPFSPDGKLAATLTNEGVLISDAATSAPLRTIPGGANRLAFSRDGAFIAVSNSQTGEYRVIKPATGEVVFTVSQPKDSTSGFPNVLGFVGDELAVVLGRPGSNDSDLRFYQPATGLELRRTKLSSIDPRLTHFISALADGERFVAVAVVPGDPALDMLALMTRTEDNLRRAQLPDGATGHALSPESDAVAFVTVAGAVHEFSLRTAETRLLGKGGGASNLGWTAYTPNGKLVLSGGGDRVRLWDRNVGGELAQLFFLGDRDWLVLARDGRFDGTPAGMRLVRYVDGNQTVPVEALFEGAYAPGLLGQLVAGAYADEPPRRLKQLPPLVRIESPRDGAELAAEEVEVTVAATDQGGGVDEVRLYHDGKLVSPETRGVKKTGARRTFRVGLLAGINELKAVALSSERVESRPAVIKISLGGAEARATLRGVVVGINRYRNETYNLNYGRPDAEAFAAGLRKHAARIFQGVHLIELYDEQATREAVEAAFDRVALQARPEDVFVFYFAGHGVMNEGTADAPAEFFLVPPDVTRLYGDDDLLRKRGLSASWLRARSVKVAARKQLFVLDACQSGGAVEAFALRGAAEQKAIFQLARSAGVVVLASSGTQQLAAEVKELGHGVFTYALLQGLDGAALGGGSGKITVKQLEAYLNDRLPELTRKYRGSAQYPASWSRGMDFPLAVTE